MPTIMQFSENSLVGVLKRCCTTQTARTRASTGSHQLSSQHAPIRGITGTDSPYEWGQVGEQVTVSMKPRIVDAGTKYLAISFSRLSGSSLFAGHVDFPAHDTEQAFLSG